MITCWCYKAPTVYHLCVLFLTPQFALPTTSVCFDHCSLCIEFSAAMYIFIQYNKAVALQVMEKQGMVYGWMIRIFTVFVMLRRFFVCCQLLVYNLLHPSLSQLFTEVSTHHFLHCFLAPPPPPPPNYYTQHTTQEPIYPSTTF